MSYTAADVDEMVAWLAKLPVGEGGVQWAWGGTGSAADGTDADGFDIFQAPGREVVAARIGHPELLRARLTEWLRARGAFTEQGGDEECPRCRSRDVESTTVGYAPESDRNQRACHGCGHKWRPA